MKILPSILLLFTTWLGYSQTTTISGSGTTTISATGVTTIPQTDVRPLDLFTGPPALAAWSLYRLKSGITSGYRLRNNTTGVETDYLPGVVAPTNRSGIKTLYDQSGNGHNITQTTTNLQPVFKISPRGSKMVADMHTTPHLLPWNATGTTGSKAWLIPSTLVVNGSNTTVVTVFLGSAETSAAVVANHMYPNIQWSDAVNYFGRFSGNASGNFTHYAWINANLRTFSKFWKPNDSNFQVQVWRSSSSGQVDLLESLTNTVGTISSNLNYTNQIGAYVGNHQGIYEDGIEVLARMVFPALTDAQISELQGLLRTAFGLTLPTRQVVTDGDSITAGYESTAACDWRDNSWAFEMQTAHPEYSLFMPNTGRASQTLTNLNTDGLKKVDALLTNSWTKNILVIFAGCNDIFYGATAAEVQTQMETYLTDRKAAGWTVIACNIIPRQDYTGPKETIRLAYNAAFNAATTAPWVGVTKVDLAALDWIPGASYALNYQDGVHPNAAGRALIHNAVWAVLQPLL